MEEDKTFSSNKIQSKPIIGKGPNSKILKEYKLTLNELNKEQWEASLGLMLGDASLQTQNKGKTYRLKFEWGDKNKDYAQHIYNLFSEWILSPPHKKIRINNNGNTVITWGFQTISHKAFNPLKDLFLIKGKKGVSSNLIKNHLTERSLSYWFMDDGGKLDYNKNSRNRSVVLNSQSFTKEEVEIMSIELSNKFSLKTNIRLNKNKYIIIIDSDSYDKFLNIIDCYIIPSMKYKLPK